MTSVIATLVLREPQAVWAGGAWDPRAPPFLCEEANHKMKGYTALLGLCLLMGVAGAASAVTTAVIDFNTPANTTASTQLITTNADGKPTTVQIGGRNAVQTGGSSSNEFLYVALPKDLFKSSP